MSKVIDLESKNVPLSKQQILNVYKYTGEIINNLSDKALQELMDGYSNDLDKLLNEMTIQVSSVINYNSATLESEKLDYLEYLEKAIDENLKIMNFSYFCTTVLTNFVMHTRNIEWANLVELYPWSAYLCQRGSGKSFQFCYALPLFKLYGYKRPHPLIAETKVEHLRKETCIITNTSILGGLHVAKIVEEINLNDILSYKLNPNGKANLGKESITTETGSILHRRSKDSALRGLHVGTAITDDFLDKSSLYSREQREKVLEVFNAEICNIVDQGGSNIVSGTPFHQQDLYSSLRDGKLFKVFSYPGIMPNMELLAPDRFSFDYLMDLKKSLGSIVFAREILVSPISDSSTLFPYEYLMRSTIGMENIRYVENIESFPIKMERIAVGCDFAISGAIGADSSVFSVLGRDKNKNIYLLSYWRAKGASHNEQVSQIVSINDRFKPNVIVMESNGFQKILADMVKQRGVRNVKEFTTTSGVKRDLYVGLPSMSAVFERGEIKIPYNPDEETQEKTQLIFSEFNGVTFNEDSGKLENSVDHDDLVMSIFMAATELRENNKMLEMFMV